MSGPDQVNLPPAEIETHIVMRVLEVAIPSDELVALGHGLAEAVEIREKIDAERKALAKSFGNDLKKCAAVINGLARKVESGTEELEIECTVTKDYAHNKFTCVRMDNDETVEDRAMTAEEGQRSFAVGRDDNVIEGDFAGVTDHDPLETDVPD